MSVPVLEPSIPDVRVENATDHAISAILKKNYLQQKFFIKIYIILMAILLDK